MIRRAYVEKREGFDMEARRLKGELADFLGREFLELTKIKSLRLLKRYDVSGLNEEQFRRLSETVLSEPQSDRVFFAPELQIKRNERFFGIEYLSGQYDQRSDSAEQCAELVTGVRPRIKTANIFIFESADKPLSDAALEGIKRYLINPVDSGEAAAGLPLSLEDGGPEAQDVPVLNGFIHAASLEDMTRQYGFAISMEDLLFCKDWFAGEGREPTLAELKVLDTYWSDHCRHTTFNTILEEIKIKGESKKKALELYEETRREVYGAEADKRRRSLMDMATIGTKALKKRGLLPDLDESSEINACTVKVNAEFANADSGEVSEPWLLLFKNETHNHPTEIEPFGGAATCLGGAIRDPLSGRAFVHQAMRVTGGGDPRAAYNETLPGKLPQIKIAREAAAGYSSYGNQIGLATGQVAEFYHPGFLAKRMELGAVIGAVPEAWVRREEPAPGDLVILVGGRTGRDGIGGATGSSKTHTNESVESSNAEVQKGNAVEERKLQRLFRKAEVSRLIKCCNDFGAGGVSVAVGELAAGLDIDLDKVPKKYASLDGIELAISESQERMAVLTSALDAEAFVKAASAENLEAVIIAKVTAGLGTEDKARLRMIWQGKTIVDFSREFLNTNGAPRSAKALINHGPADKREIFADELPAGVLLDNLERELAGLRSGSRRGLQERFDGSVGAGSVLFPWGGSEQGTPEAGMASLLPSLDKQSRTASLMSFGYDPVLMSRDPYLGAKGSIREALAKFACIGGDPFKARLSLQEYFEKPCDSETWGRPAAALLGALEAQLRLGVPAIGGKDSMSGNYRDGDTKLAVPPTLVAFAAGVTQAERVRSGALSGKRGNIIVLLSQSSAYKNGEESVGPDEWEIFKTNMKTLETLRGAVKAAYPVGPGGVAATLALMAFGNMTGVEAYAESFSRVDPMDYQGSVLLELDEAALPQEPNANWVLAGRTLDEPVYRIVGKMKTQEEDENPEALVAETPLELLRRAYEYTLSQVYPQTSTGATVAEPADETALLKLPVFKPSSFDTHKHPRVSLQGAPLVVLPVFPGTNCEWDTESAFREAGARTRLVIFKNRNREDINDSLKEMSDAFGEAQIIAFSGGFSAGDEPDGSGKFIANVIRSAPIAAAITEFLENRDGLLLGVCNGFQALIKTGLVPYGKIVPPTDTSPTLTFNAIGRHVSRMVRTRVMPNISPWLSLEKPGEIHIIPVSHGEGRLVILAEKAEALFAAGQVPFCYVDSSGRATMAEPDNPNGSAFAVEGLTSPDGRILGKMCHSERCGEFIHINIPGNKRQRIFEAGVGYFK
jgi:phosphoribosylformylglycinamidine synthase